MFDNLKIEKLEEVASEEFKFENVLLKRIKNSRLLVVTGLTELLSLFFFFVNIGRSIFFHVNHL